jgi:putative sugar O-methyltransferase
MIEDDDKLLDQLMRDMDGASDLYRPTNYWSVYEEVLIPAIRRQGISAFRSLYEPLYMSFGVTHVPDVLVTEFAEQAYGHLNGSRRAIFWVLQRTGILPRLVSNHVDSHKRTLSAFFDACFHLAIDGDQEREILKICDSGAGNPRDLFVPENHEGLQYTLSFLRYFLDYRWLKRLIDVRDLGAVFELGSGYGGQAEVLLKLYPNIRYITCDIPPQVYVAEQYLKSVFPGEVTGYQETAHLQNVDLSSTKRITVLAPWQIERVSGEVDLFWNSASFQEMEPDIVENYAKVIQPLVTRYVYLKQYPGGQKIAEKKGEVGVLKRTTIEDYMRVFDEFRMCNRGDAVQISSESPRGNPYINSKFYDYLLFERKLTT